MREIYLFQWNFAHVKILLKILGFVFIAGNKSFANTGILR